MALNAYLKLKGQKQGPIAGSVTQKGREGKIMVIATSHEIVSPRDAASGVTLTFTFAFADKAALTTGAPAQPSMTIRPGWQRD